VRDADKERIVNVARLLKEQGFELAGTAGTTRIVRAAGIGCELVNKVGEGRPHVVDMIKNDQFDLIINTTEGKKALEDSASIRGAALQHKVSYTTTIAGAEASCLALKELESADVNRLQDFH